MRFYVLLIVFFLLNMLGEYSYIGSAAITIWIWYVLNLLDKTNESIAFREFILVLYSSNYLFSPAVSFHLHSPDSFYKMKIAEDEYFTLAIPAIAFLHLGLYAIKTKIFSYNFSTVPGLSFINKHVLLQWLYLGVALNFIRSFVTGDIDFIVYLLSSIRYVAAFGLYLLDRKKYKWHLFIILLLEMIVALRAGLFHDLIMWMLFFGLFWTFISKPKLITKIAIGIATLLCFYVLQTAKPEYRKQTWEQNEEAGFSTFQKAVETKSSSTGGIFSTKNLITSLTRVNQSWIFASTIKRMDQRGDFQQLEILKKYAEAAFLPRVIAPDKLKAGDKSIFNKFSGHMILGDTSMGLGILADGYIAYGTFGVFVFTFLLGLILSTIFKIVGSWAEISPFFVLFIFPIMNYAVRPDCETQTMMGHIVKGTFVFGLIVWYYKGYFLRRTYMFYAQNNQAAINQEPASSY